MRGVNSKPGRVRCRGCLKCRPGYVRLRSTTRPKGRSSAAPPPPNNRALVGEYLFDSDTIGDYNAQGEAFDVCIQSEKLGCTAHRDFYGCTRCKGGYKLVAGRDFLAGVQMCVPVKHGCWYYGAPRR